MTITYAAYIDAPTLKLYTSSRPTTRRLGKNNATKPMTIGKRGGVQSRRDAGADLSRWPLRHVVDHYNKFSMLDLTQQEKRELIEYLKSL